MQIDKAIRFSALTANQDDTATVEFDLRDEREKYVASWTVKVPADDSADACITAARQRVLEQMRFLVRLAGD
jgi:hypothetical protein